MIGVLPSGCAMLYYMLDAQLFLQPQPIFHTEHNPSKVPRIYMSQQTHSLVTMSATENRLFLTHSLTLRVLYSYMFFSSPDCTMPIIKSLMNYELERI